MMRGRKLLFWFAYVAALPFALLAATWAIEKYIFRLQTPFVDVFGTGDLIPIATLIFLSVAADIRLEDIGRKLHFGFVINEVWFLCASVIFLVTYGAIKTNSISLLKNPVADGEDRLAAYAQLSFGVMVYVIGHSTLVKVLLEKERP